MKKILVILILILAVIPACAAERSKKLEHSIKTIRLIYPQWQGGVNPDYYFGSKLLAFIAPQNDNDETVEIPVSKNFSAELTTVEGVNGGDMLLEQKQKTADILNKKKPDRIIIFGGDCSVSEVPFDYLHGIYGDKLGILWLDAHPDVSDISNSSHLHEMVLGNLLGQSQNSNITKTKHPFTPEKVMFAGLIEKELRPMDKKAIDLNIKIATPEQLTDNTDTVLDWIRENDIEYLAVHFDLDVLSRDNFRSNTQAKPYITKEQYGAAMGELTFDKIARILKDIGTESNIVGFSIAEHMPWDALNLRKMLSDIPIFNN